MAYITRNWVKEFAWWHNIMVRALFYKVFSLRRYNSKASTQTYNEPTQEERHGLDNVQGSGKAFENSHHAMQGHMSLIPYRTWNTTLFIALRDSSNNIHACHSNTSTPILPELHSDKQQEHWMKTTFINNLVCYFLHIKGNQDMRMPLLLSNPWEILKGFWRQ